MLSPRSRIPALLGLLVLVSASGPLAQADWTQLTSPSARNLYRKMEKDGRVQITIVLGYGDVDHGYVLNPPLRDWLSKRLLERGWNEAPTFGVPREFATFDRTFTSWNGDQVRLLDSAVSESDDTNRANPVQWKLSNWVASQTWAALSQNHGAVIYLGHNRDGGGAWAFSPPAQAPNGHVDYRYYGRTNPGTQRMMHAKKRDADGIGPALIAMLSCGSNRNIGLDVTDEKSVPAKILELGKAVRKAWGDSAFLTTNRLSYFDENAYNAIALVEALTSRQAPHEWTLDWVQVRQSLGQDPFQVYVNPAQRYLRYSPAIR
jgi:hypothetical protein